MVCFLPGTISQGLAVIVKLEIVSGVLHGDGLVDEGSHLLHYRLHPGNHLFGVGHVESIAYD